MDSQTQALVQILEQSVRVVEQARTEQGWTAGAVALILLIAILGLAWMVRRLYFAVDELSKWRANILQGQIESTTRALASTSSGLDQFGRQLETNTGALRENTGAVHSLREVIAAAPCGRQVLA